MRSPTSPGAAAMMESDAASVSLSPSSATPTPSHPSAPPSENDPSEDSSRLASIARYDSLRPSALACSHPVLDSAVERSGAEAANPLANPAAVSLGAVAGSRGVALFRVDRPHAPLLVLSLASQSQASMSSDLSSSRRMGRTDPDWVSALCFQPAPSLLSSSPSPSSYYTSPPPPSFHLAAARGAGILVWDVSGHSLSPLWGRLTTATPDNNVHRSLDDDAATTVTSLAWLGGGVGGSSGIGGGGGAMLAASTATSACLWDMRAPPTSRAASKPALRFAVHPRGRGSSNSFSPYLQIACQEGTGGARCALLDRAGFLRIYDLRNVGASSTSREPLLAFQAFRSAGAGLVTGLPSSTTDVASGSETWLAWGTDAPHADDSAVVRVFEVGGSGNGSPGTYAAGDGTDDDPLLPAVDPTVDGSAIGTSTAASHASSSSCPWRIVAQCPVRHLACARVCPVPLDGGDAAFATVAFDPPVGGARTYGTLHWRAELWRLSNSAGTGIDHEDDEDTNIRPPSAIFGLERVLSFRGGLDADRQRVPPTLNRRSEGTDASSAGIFRYGSLCAAELGLVSSLPAEARQGVGRGGHPDDDHRPASSQLLLCSLTDSGCVLTHAFPEVADRRGSAPDHDRGVRRRAPGNAPTGAVRFFPRDNEYSPLPDVASGWALGSSRDPATTAVLAEASKVQALAAEVEPREALVGSSFAGTASLPTQERSGPPQLPFDMDFPSLSRTDEAVPIGSVLGLLPGGTILSPPANNVPGSELSAEDARRAAQLMERIDTSRIPCPRLCGASFGPGVGGLPIFHNGDVQKMWRWWDKSNSVRPTATAHQPVSIEGMRLDGDGSLPKRDFPRTLRDLTVMTSSAKEAQWGSQDNSDASSSGLPDVGPSFFEEGSDASSDSDDNDSEDPADKGGLYDSYFGGSRLPLVEGSPASRDASDSLSHDKQLSDHFGPASDVLSPFVCLSYHCEKLALNGQCRRLAMGWKLGSMALPPEELGPPDPTTSSFFKQDPHPARKRTDLPKYRFLVPTVQQPYRIPKVSSDPMLPNLLTLPKPTASREGDGEHGVHGGDYGVRPNMQESMVFLRKLFTHHHEPSLFSPPDGPMLPNSRSDPAVSKTASGSAVTQINTTTPSSLKAPSNGSAQPSPIGLYTLRAIDPLSHDALEELKTMEENCLHNSQVCMEIGASGKGATWDLLAKAVGSRRRDFGTSFDSPSAGGRGALGTKLVERLLRFYEVQGDVQMLATMVCVLRNRSANHSSNAKSWSLLPSNQSLKFDLYISRYADLLFSWDLLTTRTELNKHLVSAAARKATSASFMVGDASRDGMASASTLALAFACPRCSQETVAPGTNYCRMCQDYAFRCIVCDHAIRGLFASCELCGHGGHLEHLQLWFASHDVCPTGCGCRCAASGRSGLGSSGVAAAPAAPVTTSRPPEPVATATTASAPFIEPAAELAGLFHPAESRRLVEV